jgi:hypothetical protein
MQELKKYVFNNVENWHKWRRMRIKNSRELCFDSDIGDKWVFFLSNLYLQFILTITTPI